MFKNVVGLVVEYNPFHNGHLHHIQEIDKLFEDNIKIAVMSGDFVQRGEPSLLNKFEKTKVALSHGIDIVIELPAFYSCQSAEIFASASYIRKKILSLDKDKINLSFAKDLVPKFSFDTLEKNFFYLISLENFYDLIRYEILKNKEDLKNIQDMEVGLENRLYESALKNLDFNCFFNEILSKRLTISRLQRILLHILLGLTKDVTNNTKFSIPFVKILGFSKKGQEYLNFLKKTDSYKENKILTSNRNLKEFLNEEEKFLFEFNERCSQIYRIKSNYDNLNYPIIFKGD